MIDHIIDALVQTPAPVIVFLVLWRHADKAVSKVPARIKAWRARRAERDSHRPETF